MHNQPSRSAGFTLIELSIVLVVIGLIAAGVLVGNSMIENARLQKVASKVTEFTTAINTFRLKYNCTPGDCVNAPALGFPDNFTLNLQSGDGNGFVNTPGESNGFLYQLNTANLIGAVEIFPLVAPGFEISNIKTGLRNIRISSRNTSQDTGIYLALDDANDWENVPAAIQPIESFQIDTKIDDGLPLSGKTQAIDYPANPIESSPAASTGVAGSESCVITGINSYNSNATRPASGTGLCGMKFQLR